MAKNSNMEMHTVYEMYKWYVKKKLSGPEGHKYSTEFDKFIRRKGIVVLLKEDKNKIPQVYMTYSTFRAIIEKNNATAREYITRGMVYSIGMLGYIRPKRIERNFSKPRANWPATAKYRNDNPGSKVIVYYTDDDYIRIGLDKVTGIRNQHLYEFKPCKDFRISFSKANLSNPLLKMNYQYLSYRSHDN